MFQVGLLLLRLVSGTSGIFKDVQRLFEAFVEFVWVLQCDVGQTPGVPYMGLPEECSQII